MIFKGFRKKVNCLGIDEIANLAKSNVFANLKRFAKLNYKIEKFAVFTSNFFPDDQMLITFNDHSKLITGS